MGNCINVKQSSPNKISVLVSNGGEETFKVATKVRKITSGKTQGYDLVHFDQPNLPLRPNTKLHPAEVYVLIPRVDQLSSEVVSCRPPQKVKIVVTRKQLEVLARSEKDFEIRKISRRSWHMFEKLLVNDQRNIGYNLDVVLDTLCMNESVI